VLRAPRTAWLASSPRRRLAAVWWARGYDRQRSNTEETTTVRVECAPTLRANPFRCCQCGAAGVRICAVGLQDGRELRFCGGKSPQEPHTRCHCCLLTECCRAVPAHNRPLLQILQHCAASPQPSRAARSTIFHASCCTSPRSLPGRGVSKPPAWHAWAAGADWQNRRPFGKRGLQPCRTAFNYKSPHVFVTYPARSSQAVEDGGAGAELLAPAQMRPR
jgi:hypothetical protein